MSMKPAPKKNVLPAKDIAAEVLEQDSLAGGASSRAGQDVRGLGTFRNRNMEVTFINVCTRCGKPRIVSKKWTEKVTNKYGTSIIRHVETVCPDPACQAKVDKELAATHQKKVEIEEARHKRQAGIKL